MIEELKNNPEHYNELIQDIKNTQARKKKEEEAKRKEAERSRRRRSRKKRRSRKRRRNGKKYKKEFNDNTSLEDLNKTLNVLTTQLQRGL